MRDLLIRIFPLLFIATDMARGHIYRYFPSVACHCEQSVSDRVYYINESAAFLMAYASLFVAYKRLPYLLPFAAIAVMTTLAGKELILDELILNNNLYTDKATLLIDTITDCLSIAISSVIIYFKWKPKKTSKTAL